MCTCLNALQEFRCAHIMKASKWNKNVDLILKTICYLLGAYMIILQVQKFIENNDVSSVSLSDLNSSFRRTYPTFTICLETKYLQENRETGSVDNKSNDTRYFDKQLNVFSYYDGFEKVDAEKRIRSAAVLLHPNDIFLQTQSIAPDNTIIDSWCNNFFCKTDNPWNNQSNPTNVNSALPMHLTYQDPTQTCYTRNLDYKVSLTKKFERVLLAGKSLADKIKFLRIYIHKPGQLIRKLNAEIGEFEYKTITEHMVTGFTYENYQKNTSLLRSRFLKNQIYVSMSQIIAIKKRVDGKQPCNEAIKDEDKHILEFIINKLKCIPPYWKSVTLLKNHTFPECETLSQLKGFYKKDIRSSIPGYLPQCEDISIASTVQLRKSNDRFAGLVDLTFDYLDKTIVDVTNERDFGVQSLWSGIGGFIGIFIGVSLLQLSELIFFRWIRKIVLWVFLSNTKGHRIIRQRKNRQDLFETENQSLCTDGMWKVGRIIFTTFCYYLAVYLSVLQLERFLRNADKSSIEFVRLNTNPQTEYPGYTICFESRGLVGMYKKQYLKTRNTTSHSYQNALMGVNTLDASIENIDFKNATVSIDDIFAEFDNVYNGLTGKWVSNNLRTNCHRAPLCQQRPKNNNSFFPPIPPPNFILSEFRKPEPEHRTNTILGHLPFSNHPLPKSKPHPSHKHPLPKSKPHPSHKQERILFQPGQQMVPIDFPMYLSYQNPKEICYTRKSDFENKHQKHNPSIVIRNIEGRKRSHFPMRENDYVVLNEQSSDGYFEAIRIYVHKAEQFIETFDKEFARYKFSDLVRKIPSGEETVVHLSISMLNPILVHKRNKFPSTCSRDVDSRDLAILQQIVKTVGCIPQYWKSIIRRENDSNICTSPTVLKKISNYQIAKDIKVPEPPCSEMNTAVTISETMPKSKLHGRRIALTLNYGDEHLIEVTNLPDFDFETFWSNIGGFVGMFIGISLLDLPVILGSTINVFRHIWSKEKPRKIESFSKNSLSRLKSLLNMAFAMLCWLLVGLISIRELQRYTRNENVSLMKFEELNTLPKVDYPTFTICFEENMRERGMYKTRYEAYRRALFENTEYDSWVLNVDFNNATLGINDIFEQVETHLTNNLVSNKWCNKDFCNMSHPNVHFPFYLSYQDPTKKCYTRRSVSKPYAVKKYDLVIIKGMLNRFTPMHEAFHDVSLYVHQPGQVIRSFSQQVDRIKYRLLYDYGGEYSMDSHLKKMSKINFNLLVFFSRIILNYNRPDGPLPCNPDLKDEDSLTFENVVKKLSCIPVYWFSFVNKNSTMRHGLSPCNISYNHLNNLGYKITHEVRSHNPPCSEMRILSNVVRTPYDNDEIMRNESVWRKGKESKRGVARVVTLKFNFLDDTFMEITDHKAFGFESLWSSVAGFIGIFVGYSLIQLPDAFAAILNFTSKYLSLRNCLMFLQTILNVIKRNRRT